MAGTSLKSLYPKGPAREHATANCCASGVPDTTLRLFGTVPKTAYKLLFLSRLKGILKPLRLYVLALSLRYGLSWPAEPKPSLPWRRQIELPHAT